MGLPSPQIIVTVNTPDELDQKLNTAELQARALAAEHAVHGVLITRRSPAVFVVEISNEVPYGMTHECRAW